MGLPRSKQSPKSKIKFLFYIFRLYATNKGCRFRRFGLKWVAMARHGLKLYENEATGLKSIS